MSIVPLATINDDTPITEACEYVAKRLSAVTGITKKMEDFATLLLGKKIFCVVVLRAKGFTFQQMDDLLNECDLDETVLTVQYAWKIPFTNPSAPSGGTFTLADKDKSQSHMRVSRYLEPGEKTLGEKLKALNLLDKVVLSPRLKLIIVNPSKLTPTDFKEAVKESLLWTIVTYSMVNLDVAYLDQMSGLFDKEYPDVPEGENFRRALKSLSENKRKDSAMILGTLPLADLSTKAVALVRDKGYPILIDDSAPSTYANLYSSTEAEGAREQGGSASVDKRGDELLAETERSPMPASQGAGGVRNKCSNSERKALGSVGSATNGFHLLPPKPPANATPSPLSKTTDAGIDPPVDESTSTPGGSTGRAPKGKRSARSPVTHNGPAKRRKASTAQERAAPESQALTGADDKSDESASPIEEEEAPESTDERKDELIEQQMPGLEAAYKARRLVALEYDQALEKVGQLVLNYHDGKWEMCRISNLTHSQRKWLQYLNLPKVKSHKKADKGKLVLQEILNEFNKDLHGKHWVFVKEEFETYANFDEGIN